MACTALVAPHEKLLAAVEQGRAPVLEMLGTYARQSSHGAEDLESFEQTVAAAYDGKSAAVADWLECAGG